MGAYSGANLASHKALDLGDVSPDRGQLWIKKSKFIDTVKQIGYIGVIVSKSGLIFELGLLLWWHLVNFFVKNLTYSQKLLSQIFSGRIHMNRTCIAILLDAIQLVYLLFYLAAFFSMQTTTDQ